MTKLSLSPGADFVSKPRGRIVRVTWRQPTPPPHEFVAIACPEEEGGYSVFAINFPGVISQGETLDEVKTNIAEAFLAMLGSRRKHGEDMQFSHSPALDVSADCIRLRIKVDG